MAESLTSVHAPTKELFIRVTKGQNQGQVFRIRRPEVFIGRSPQNHIQINDEKISRKHVRLDFNGDRVLITDVSEENFIKINGEVLKKSELSHQSRVEIGSHELQFLLKDKKTQAEAVKKNKIPFIVAALGLVALLFYFLSGPAQKIDLVLNQIETLKSMEESLSKETALLDQLKEKQKESSFSQKSLLDSKKFFLQGRRNYYKGDFLNAIERFRSVLALNPEDSKARNFLMKAEKKFEEQIDYKLAEGFAYREQGKYSFCISSMKQVVHLLQDPKDSRYAEAKTILDQCYISSRGHL